MKGTRKLHVLLLAGGRSAEHPISLRSGATVLDGLEKAGHRITLVGITREGLWVHRDLASQPQRAPKTRAELDPAGTTPVSLAWTGKHTRLLSLDGSDLGP